MSVHAAAQVLDFLAQLCLGDLFSDKYSPCDYWPVMICHVRGSDKGGEHCRGEEEKNTEKGRQIFSEGCVFSHSR